MINTIIMHCCGGAGITGGDYVAKRLMSLGDGFANIKVNYLDTSRTNIDKIEPDGEFWLVKTKSNSKTEITGSGGERRTHAVDIMENVNEYLDKNNYTKRVPDEYHIVIASASGGSGSTISPLLIKGLISKNIPTILVLIGDSSNGLNAKNTLKTIAGLDSIVRSLNKPLSVIYVNNHTLMKNKSMKEAEKEANEILANILTTISLFLSGENEAIDNQDMYGIIDQSHYVSFNIEPGLYGLSVHSKEIHLPEGAIPTVGRTLTLDGLDFDTNLTLIHHKRGYVTSENAIKIAKDSNFPIHLISCANYLELEESNLRKIEAEYENIMSNIKSKSLSSNYENSVDKDTGLIF